MNLSCSLIRQVVCSGRNLCHSSMSIRWKSSEVAARIEQQFQPAVSSVLSTSNHTVRVLFSDHKSADFKTIWLRDNCKCPACVDPSSGQKLIDTPALDISAKPRSLNVTDSGDLVVSWQEQDQSHESSFDASWLYKYGKSFMLDKFESESSNVHSQRPPKVLWDRTEIWRHFPEISYEEVMQSREGLKSWLDMFHKYGVVVMRGVPTTQGKLVEVVRKFAYVKETSYGVTFDVVNEPTPGAHLAYSGKYLSHHTDLNYREKSPGMQLLHCLKANDPKKTGKDPGGMSFFVDGFKVAKWLEETEPAAFHILTSTPIRFQIKHKEKSYSQLWTVICVDQDGELTEIHYNNRTMGPLQVPSHVVMPFYHAYRLFSEKMRDSSAELRFHLLPGDLVAFNNRRVLHGRTGFDPTLVSRHLEGCYVDIDEVMSLYDSMLAKN